MDRRVINTTVKRIPKKWDEFISFLGLDKSGAVYDSEGTLYGLEIPHATMSQEALNHKLATIEYIGQSRPGEEEGGAGARVEFYRFGGVRYQIAYLAYSWAISEVTE